MKRFFQIFIILGFLLPVQAWSLDVVPGLKGFGTETRAAHGNNTKPTICVVNTLNPDTGISDSTRNGVAVKVGGLGSFINWSVNNKLIIFEVSGYIDLGVNKIKIDNNYVTIAGQTAPSPGVTLKRGTVVIKDSHDILIQHIRVRWGDDPPGGLSDPQPYEFRAAFNITGSAASTYNIVVDHCSVSWTTDQNFNVYQSSGAGPTKVTVSNNITSEGLYNSYHPEKPHSKGMIISRNIEKIAIINNLFAHNMARNPVVYTGETVFANNVIYNPAEYPPRFHKIYNNNMDLSYIGNVIIRGPESQNLTSKKCISLGEDLYPGTPGRVYLDDNICEDDADGNARGDSWDAVHDLHGIEGNVRVNYPPILISGFTPFDSENVQDYVLANVGARPVDRDSADTRIVADVIARTGNYIDSQKDVGWPNLVKNTRRLELPTNPHSDDDGDGYTNIEEWLHEFAAQVEGSGAESPLNPPTGLKVLE